MANPINYVPLDTPFFDGRGDPEGPALVKKLGNLSRVWAVFFASESGWATQGLHVERVGATAVTGLDPRSVPDGGLYVETDRASIYESRFVSKAQVWVFVLGRMQGLLTARPVDLGMNDVGFLFVATDALDYRWSGTAWVALDTVRGGASLVDVNRVTKVTAAGVIGESSITDDGTTVSTPEPILVDPGAGNGGYIRLFPGDAAHAGYIDWYDKNRVRIAFMGYVDGALYITFENGNNLRLASGKLGVGKAATYGVDVAGDVNVDPGQVFRVNALQVVGARLGAIAAPTINTTTATSTAVVPYAANEAAMINQHVTAINQLNADVASLATAVNLLRDALRIATGHGLTA